jgi:hypothetical protein
LITVETRRSRGDLAEMFNICKEIDCLDAQKFFDLRITSTSGNSLKPVKHQCHLDSRKFSFSLRVVNIWNSLSDELIACDSLLVLN